MWKLDIVSSIGVAVAFAVQMILLRTPLSFLTPFIDPAVAVVMAVLLIMEPVKVIFSKHQKIWCCLLRMKKLWEKSGNCRQSHAGLSV